MFQLARRASEDRGRDPRWRVGLTTSSGVHVANATDEFKERKAKIREQAHANRNQQENKDELSRQICSTFMTLPEYAAAKTVMFYVDVRSEVRTRHSLPDALKIAKSARR